jgi:protein involved in polysaccharide export with SLBB domain
MLAILNSIRISKSLFQSRIRFSVQLILLIVSFGFAHKANTQQATQEIAQTASSNYKLSPGDLFDFRVYQETDLDSVVRVSGDGTAIFPLVGTVKLGGLTIEQATTLLQSRYRDGFLVNPQVTITIRTFAKKFYTMLGQISRPGSYDMQGEEEIPLFQAVGLAGGYTKIANPSRVTIKRKDNQSERIIKLNAKKMAGGDEKSTFMIRAGDIITIGESIF